MGQITFEDFKKTKRLTDSAISSAIRHADMTVDKWQEIAYGHLLDFLSFNNGDFIAEQARTFAEKMGCPAPPDTRAWGGIIRKAKTNGVIICVGRVSPPHVHGSLVSVWRKV